MTGVDEIPILDWNYVFYRTDRHEARQDHDLHHHVRGLRRFAERKVNRLAGKDGIAFSPSRVDIDRDASMRLTKLIVWFSYAIIPSEPGARLIIKPGAGNKLMVPRLNPLVATCD